MKNNASNETLVEYRVANFTFTNTLKYQKNKKGILLSDRKIDSRTFKAKFLKLKKSKVPRHSINTTPEVFTCGFKVIKNTSYILN